MAKALQLSNMPKPIRDLILDEQTRIKKGCECQYSQENTVYHILKEWAKLKGIEFKEVDEPEVTVDKLK